METITLPSGHEVLLDKEDYERLKGFRYYLHKKGYAYRFTSNKKGKKAVYMHHDVIGKQEGKVVDHINRNKLDNRKSNLRHITNRQNLMNIEKTRKKSTSSVYKGVCWVEGSKAWKATVRDGDKTISLGYFRDEKTAAHAYNAYVKKIHGEFAVLNDVAVCDWESLKLNRRDGTGKSKYRGVSFIAKSGKWQAHITHNYKSIYLGCYEDEITAAKVYNEAAIKYKGDKAKLNAIPKEAEHGL